MTVIDDTKHERNLRETFAQVVDLLDKQELVSDLTIKQGGSRPDLVQSLLTKQHLVELQRKLERLHPADVAFVLEGLPLARREMVWDLVSDDRRGAILLEVSEAVRDHLIGEMQRSEIVEVAEHLDSDQIADLAPSLPKDTVLEILNTLDNQDRSQVQTVLSFPPGSVGSLMAFDMITVRDDVTLDVVLRYLRKRRDTDDQLSQFFVVDRAGTLKGLLPLKTLIVNDPDILVGAVMEAAEMVFFTDDQARDAVHAFERYDLITAPVVNIHHQLVGVISVDAVVDFINESVQRQQLKQAGLREDEDLFGPLWKSGKNRWVWLAINLLTAFIASRVIGAFEDTIAKLVALAALMPIVASIGGNTGNQTVALMVRGLALDQLDAANVRHLFFKELGISVINGMLWGGVVGLFAYFMYGQAKLALVMTAAMLLNLLIASIAGVCIPLALHRMGRDPAFGSSVMLTAITDCMGFFVFLGLATVFLF